MNYLTVEELQALLPSLFTPSELLAVNWANYTPNDLKAILERSEGFINSLRYKGKFKEDNQLRAFPRILSSGLEVSEKNERVLKAICCIVFDFLKADFIGTSRIDLINQGVKSISTGGVSESYSDIKDIKVVSENYVKYLGFCLFQGVL